MQFLRTLFTVLPAALLGLTAIVSASDSSPPCDVCVFTKSCKSTDVGCKVAADCGVTGNWPKNADFTFSTTLVPRMTENSTDTLVYSVVDVKDPEAPSTLYAQFGLAITGDLPRYFIKNDKDTGILFVTPTKGGFYLAYTINAKSQCADYISNNVVVEELDLAAFAYELKAVRTT